MKNKAIAKENQEVTTFKWCSSGAAGAERTGGIRLRPMGPGQPGLHDRAARLQADVVGPRLLWGNPFRMIPVYAPPSVIRSRLIAFHVRLRANLAARIDNAVRGNRHHNAFHHAGTTMMASPRNTARRARSANARALAASTAPSRGVSSSLTPLWRPYWPPVRIGVRITPGHSTETCTPVALGLQPQN